MKLKILIVDDDPNTLAQLARAFRMEGLEAVVAESAETALQRLRENGVDAVVSDVVMPGTSGLELLEAIRRERPDLPGVMISGQATIEIAVRATRSGAIDFLEKPVSAQKLLVTVENAVRLRRLEEENVELRRQMGDGELLFRSPAMKQVASQVELVAPTDSTVCILGETGVGKELVARAIHRASPRRDGPFIQLNCAAVPAELIESELFGHEKGSFTGAVSRHIGKFEAANGGTLFLDEIGDMPADSQIRLLRVIAEGEFYRVGGHNPVQVDVRIITATHQHLERRVEDGTFREDLFHRLNVIRVHVPPLAERREDIPLLANHFLQRATNELGEAPKVFDATTLEALAALPWPGNVRQLENTCRWLAVMVAGPVVLVDDLPPELKAAPPTSEAGNWEDLLAKWANKALAEEDGRPLLKHALPTFERILIKAALARTGGRRVEAAERLGWGRNTLTRKIAELRLTEL